MDSQGQGCKTGMRLGGKRKQARHNNKLKQSIEPKASKRGFRVGWQGSHELGRSWVQGRKSWGGPGMWKILMDPPH